MRAVALAAALQVNSGLQVLSLRFNEIADSGATALAKALQANTSVLEVHLGGNLIGAEGAVQLAAALVHNASSRNDGWTCVSSGVERACSRANASFAPPHTLIKVRYPGPWRATACKQVSTWCE